MIGKRAKAKKPSWIQSNPWLVRFSRPRFIRLNWTFGRWELPWCWGCLLACSYIRIAVANAARAQSTSKSVSVSFRFAFLFWWPPPCCGSAVVLDVFLSLFLTLTLTLTLISHLIPILLLTQRSISVPALAPSAISPSSYVLGSNNTTLNLHLTDLCDRFLHARCLDRKQHDQRPTCCCR